MTNPIKKYFDCLAYKQAVQLKIYSEINHLTPAEEMAYFQKGVATSSLAQWWKSIEPQSHQIVFSYSHIPEDKNTESSERRVGFASL
ncbi:MAG: hypothetical protein VSS75_032980 [Candidatus Parabeggiatoa sp.]|nr:hypothetical protein [Candidatus Parabeggiatoa sp.]